MTTICLMKYGQHTNNLPYEIWTTHQQSALEVIRPAKNLIS